MAWFAGVEVRALGHTMPTLSDPNPLTDARQQLTGTGSRISSIEASLPIRPREISFGKREVTFRMSHALTDPPSVMTRPQ